MLKCFKNFDAKKTGLFAAGVLLVPQESRFFPARMQRNFIQIVQQPYSVQRKLF